MQFIYHKISIRVYEITNLISTAKLRLFINKKLVEVSYKLVLKESLFSSSKLIKWFSHNFTYLIWLYQCEAIYNEYTLLCVYIIISLQFELE